MIIVLVMQMGVFTPLVGINVYVVNGIARDIPLEVIFRGILPFLVALILGTHPCGSARTASRLLSGRGVCRSGGAGRVREIRVLERQPAEVILAEAARIGADLIVVGWVLLGSVSHKVLQRALVPVLVVRLP